MISIIDQQSFVSSGFMVIFRFAFLYRPIRLFYFCFFAVYRSIPATCSIPHPCLLQASPRSEALQSIFLLT